MPAVSGKLYLNIWLCPLLLALLSACSGTLSVKSGDIRQSQTGAGLSESGSVSARYEGGNGLALAILFAALVNMDEWSNGFGRSGGPSPAESWHTEGCDGLLQRPSEALSCYQRGQHPRGAKQHDTT